MLFVVAIEGEKHEFKSFWDAKWTYEQLRLNGCPEAVLRREDENEVLVWNSKANAFFLAYKK